MGQKRELLIQCRSVKKKSWGTKNFQESTVAASLINETGMRDKNHSGPIHKDKRENKYISFAGWEVRIVKNCDRGLENAAQGRSRGQHFQGQGHSFSLYGPTLSRQIIYLSFSCDKLAYK